MEESEEECDERARRALLIPHHIGIVEEMITRRFEDFEDTVQGSLEGLRRLKTQSTYYAAEKPYGRFVGHDSPISTHGSSPYGARRSFEVRTFR